MSYYAVSIFISAFLLFQIQPMISKYILPWFGGTPAVWSTSLLFFQVLLTGGYAYAYWLIGKHSPRKQGLIHMGLLVFSLLLLSATAFFWASPITPGASWRPEGVALPILQVLKILGAAVGIPYFLLATNSTLMQAWFSRDFPENSPYRLYALSNVGSLLALATYPVLVEPNLTLNTQARLWSGGYALFALLGFFGAYQTFKRKQVESPVVEADDQTEVTPKTGWNVKVLWALLPASASILLLAITNQVTQEVAAIPFLWVLPLTIYLLSFILTFDSERWYSRTWFLLALIVTSGLFIWLIIWHPDVYYLTELTIYSALLFVACMVAHGELVKLRPHPRQLTSFYLLVSVGGALGGIFVNLITPRIFTGYFELQWGVFLIWVLLAVVMFLRRDESQKFWLQRGSLALTAVTAAVVGYYMTVSVQRYSSRTYYETRNYYGILRVKDQNRRDETYRAYRMVHGTIVHGYQLINPEVRHLPTAYFTEESGIGITFLHHPKRPGNLRVGILGLGVGAQAAYAQPGDLFRFYEINPAVVDLAEGEGGYFSYLSDAQGEVTVVLGDARLSLERELEMGQNQQFDLLVMDAFSGDSIPVHLITREAFVLYLQHLAPNGILALDITNIHLDLQPIVVTAAKEFGLDYAIIRHKGDGLRSESTLWAILSADKDFMNLPIIRTRQRTVLGLPEEFRLWTDDYSNLFQILK
ncbi:MAG: fused MFS/spermidine synthase [Anaerolineales bacterium]